ncbi:hypothetical protein [Candidatus Atelocyanobacterium thalassae]|uniref:CDP-alcohol phosphatidyltransferase n=1 Tax=cyanobacterium endosymbiont of Braarudosphaera bigelowii TaxID=1285375 RepID=A0ABN6K055_9CHRO|nr:hypothetical protein [Candidatus Atelocyanobacterium thalassa]BDA40129.1 hypothetical protein CPARK_000096800 [cyanobacterium endosymbiont of Braarudosphaera bigelowii]
MILLLFSFAGVNIFYQLTISTNWNDQILCLTIFMMCLEQAKMATVDFTNIRISKKYLRDPQLDNFLIITSITITMELLGFYLVSFSKDWSIAIILISLIFFNSFAKINILVLKIISIECSGIFQRISVLTANYLGLGIMILKMFNFFPIIMSLILLSMTLAYITIKYSSNLLPNNINN